MEKIILFKNDDGSILQATDFEPVDRDELVEQLEEARDVVSKLQAAIERYDALNDQLPVTDSTQPLLHGEDDGDGHVTFKPVAI